MIKIGFTYDLKSDYLKAGFSEEQAAEFDAPETIEGITNALKLLGFDVDPIGNVRQLSDMLHQGKRWDIVFNISEGSNGLSREAQVPALLDVYHIPYVFSDALTLSLALHKGYCKHVVRDSGIPTAPFFVVNNADDINDINLPYPLFVKPVAQGSSKGVAEDSRVVDFASLECSVLKRLELFNEPVLVETYLSGKEYTVGIIGNGAEARVLGMMEVSFKQGADEAFYSFAHKAEYEKMVEYKQVPDHIEQKCSKTALAAWKALGCRDGGRVDVRFDDNEIAHFIEVNPLAGLNPIHSDLPILARMKGISYLQLIAMIMQTALKRMAINDHAIANTINSLLR